jgi:insertion element IS1 protein InsB
VWLPVYPHHPTRYAVHEEDQRCPVVLEWCVDEPHRVPLAGLGSVGPQLDQVFAKAHYEKPEPTGKTLVLELDEMWHYVNKKRQKLWIWKVLDRDTGQLLDWECGRRDKATLKRLVDRLVPWDVYCTDQWGTYASVIPPDKLVQSKRTTHDIERNHCRQRHWFGRFERKSIIVSKSKEMVDLTMALFARFWVNGNQDELISLLG